MYVRRSASEVGLGTVDAARDPGPVTLDPGLGTSGGGGDLDQGPETWDPREGEYGFFKQQVQLSQNISKLGIATKS